MYACVTCACTCTCVYYMYIIIQMVWEQNVTVIVMLTAVTDMGLVSIVLNIVTLCMM